MAILILRMSTVAGQYDMTLACIPSMKATDWRTFTPRKRRAWLTARLKRVRTTREYACTSTVQPFDRKAAPCSAIVARARYEVSANTLPRCVARIMGDLMHGK